MTNFEKKYSHIKLMPFQYDPFNGDTFLEQRFIELRDKHGIKTAIELGTCLGGTAAWYAKNFDKVYTTEINPTFFQIAKEFLHQTLSHEDYAKIEFYLSDTVVVLSDILSHVKGEIPIITCDDHWLANNPLLEELAIIAASGIKPVIMIHDFKVPDHPELGFDSYGGQDYEWSWVEKSIEAIYGKDGYTKTYNSEASGAMRGVVVIEPV